MKPFRVIFCIMIIAMLSNCSSNFIVGHYSKKNNPHGFVFNTDSTFTYQYYGYCRKGTSGIWHQRGNKIHLNSHGQVDRFPLNHRICESDSMQNKLHVIIDSPNKNKMNYIAIPVINDHHIEPKPERGDNLFLIVEKMDSIHFIVLKDPIDGDGLGYGTYMCFDKVITEKLALNLSTNEGMEITINIIDSLFRYRVFKDTELKIGRKRLLFKDEGKKHKLRLRSLQ